MMYSYKALKELSRKYRSILRKCALLNAAAILGLMPVAANAAAIVCAAGENCNIAAGDEVLINQNITMTGNLTGSGKLILAPEKISAGVFNLKYNF